MQLDDYYNLTVDEFRSYRNQHQEADYVLVDVRLPEEYEDEHIPGCTLIPLGELTDRLTELPSDCDIIFYCNSGRRSRAAALFATSVPFFQEKVYNVLGGILAYHDRTLPDYPILTAIDLDSNTADLLQSAMNLERGTSLFYTAVLQKSGDVPFRATLEKIARAEDAHARLLYTYLKKERPETPPFAQVYSSLSGDVVEGGKRLDDQMAILDKLLESSSQALLELILDIEYAAYDLYNAVAHKLRRTGMEEAFLSLAQAEKYHMQLAAEALGTGRS